MNSLTGQPLSILIPPPTSTADCAPPTPSSDNPLIPKRRRRTTPHELALLEEEFVRNPLPTPGERAKIAERVGMTARGVQVWLQNRRQKEKKDASTYAPSSGGPKSSSSSHSHMDDDRYSFYGGSSSPISTSSAAPSPLFAPPSLPPFPSSIGDKENATRNATPYVYTYHPRPSPALSSAHTTATATSSIINIPPGGAKKHTKKRPLGSHAPLARKPSLSHNFNFPDSPPKARKGRGTLKRQVSVDCLKTIGDSLFSDLGGKERERKRVKSEEENGEGLRPPPTLRTHSLPLPTLHSPLSPVPTDSVLLHMLSDPPPTSSPTSSSSSFFFGRATTRDSCAERALSRKRNKLVDREQEDEVKKMSVRAAARVLSTVSRRRSAGEEEEEEPDLSFGSTATESSMEGTPGKGEKAWSKDGPDETERECAELLLGLGGFI